MKYSAVALALIGHVQAGGHDKGHDGKAGHEEPRMQKNGCMNTDSNCNIDYYWNTFSSDGIMSR